MAIFHLRAQIISRSQGRSAVACAAYRAADKLYDERSQTLHDYSRKEHVAHSEILLPQNAPDWMSQREKLWNRVEESEKRKDSQLSREVRMSLPRELTLEQNIALAREYVQKEFVDQGMVADLNIHIDKAKDGEPQPHAHVMLTLREITPDGFGKKNREWNRTDLVEQWREAWANTTNRHLALQGLDLRIDHRSNAAQGIDLEPQHKIGCAIAQERMARWEDHQRIARENGEAILKEPTIALTAITRQQSTFTHQDIARFINRHTVNAEQFQTVFDKVKGCDALLSLGLDGQGRERFTTQEMLALETRLIAQALELKQRFAHGVSEIHKANALNQRRLTPQQQEAFNHLVATGDMACVIGYAGTGKSYLLGAAREAWEAQGYQVLGATLSGIAAEGLAGSSGIESRTLASRFYQWDKGREQLTARSVLVIDEAGMIGSRQMAKLMAQAHGVGAKVVLIGDPEQLQAIEAGAAFRAIAERTDYVELTEIRRQSVVWQQDATRELATGKTAEAIARYAAHDHLHVFATQEETKRGMVALWNDVRLNQPNKTQIMLAYRRADVQELNERARALRQEQGELGQDHVIQTERGERLFAAHDRIYFLKNERSLGVMNGTLGTIEQIEGKQLKVRLDSQEPNRPGRVVTVDINHYDQLDHGYAATMHKSQSVTVDRSYVLASQYFDAHATYVGMSRHRESAELFWSRDVFENERALVRGLSRQRGKDVTMDYISGTEDLARRYGLEREPKQNPVKVTLVPDKAVPHISPLHEQRLQQAAQAYNSLHRSPTRDSLQDFKARFEANHPEQAKQLREAIKPAHERKAQEVEQHIQALEKDLDKRYAGRVAKEKLEKYAAGLLKQPEMMAYLKQHHRELSNKIQGLAKSYDRSLSLDREISR